LRVSSDALATISATRASRVSSALLCRASARERRSLASRRASSLSALARVSSSRRFSWRSTSARNRASLARSCRSRSAAAVSSDVFFFRSGLISFACVGCGSASGPRINRAASDERDDSAGPKIAPQSRRSPQAAAAAPPVFGDSAPAPSPSPPPGFSFSSIIPPSLPVPGSDDPPPPWVALPNGSSSSSAESAHENDDSEPTRADDADIGDPPAEPESPEAPAGIAAALAPGPGPARGVATRSLSDKLAADSRARAPDRASGGRGGATETARAARRREGRGRRADSSRRRQRRRREVRGRVREAPPKR
jgi:hypothetical protein